MGLIGLALIANILQEIFGPNLMNGGLKITNNYQKLNRLILKIWFGLILIYPSIQIY